MRSSIRKRADGGFTLVEVLVALAIAGGTLVLVLGANNASLRQTVEARERVRLEEAAESKLQEVLQGIEPVCRGDLEGLPGWRWESMKAVTHVAELKKLQRVTLFAYAPDGAKMLEIQSLTYPEARGR